MALLKIKKPHEIDVRVFVKALLYGQPGIGKSTLGLSAPRPLYIDCDDSAYRVAKRHQKDTIGVTAWEDITDVLTGDITDYESLVIDTVGKMLMFMNEYVGRLNPKNKQTDGTLTQKGFGVRKQLFIEFVNKITSLGKHVIFIAHDTEKSKGDATFSRPDVGGSSGQDLVRELDLVGYMEAIGSQRSVSFDPTETHYGKNTCGLPSIMYLPDLNKAENNLLTMIFTEFKKGIVVKQEMDIKYANLMQSIKERVDAIKKPKDANELYTWLNEYKEHVWSSLYEGKLAVANKAKELGFIANPATKQFEPAPAPPKPPKPDPKADGKEGDKQGGNKPANANGGGTPEQGQDPLSEEEKKRIAENENLA